MKPHYIKPNIKCRIPQNLLFYDTETSETKLGNKKIHKLRLGVARYIRLHKTRIVLDKVFIFKTTTEFWDNVEGLIRSNTRLWMISHNQHFDFNVLNGFEELLNRGWKLRKMVLESDVFILKFTKEKKTLLVVDSTNYFKAPLKTLGEQIGLPKLEINFEKATDEELIKYCKRDVEILSEYFLRFLEWWHKNNLGNFTVSIAGLAFNAFKHRFMKTKILVHRDEEPLKLEIESYRGGRNECLYIGEVNEEIYKLDVNSMYPFAMKYNPYPIKYKKTVKEITTQQLTNLMRKYLAICNVCLETNENAYGVKREKLIFPIGRFKAVLATPELRYALDNNHIIKVYKCTLYDYDFIFKDYVDYFYELKVKAEREGNKLLRNFAKLMMNSLYGKFAQRVRELKEIPYPPLMKFGSTIVHNIKTHEEYKLYFINYKAYKLERERELFYDANIAIASHVTAYARMYLWFLMKKAGLENVYYVDTDSLFVNRKGYENLKELIGDDLGKLKLEGQADHAIFFAPKDYVFGNEVKIKGVKQDSVKINDNTYLVDTWLRTKTLISKGLIGQAMVEQRLKILKRAYDKGVVMEDGRVKPLELNEPCQ